MFGRRVLLLIPHPDDEIVGAAIAVERLRRQGGVAYGLYLTSGVPRAAGSWLGGHFTYGPRADRRWQEALAVARGLGLCIAGRQRIPARTLKSHLGSSLRWIREQAKALGVDRIWVPAYEGGHQDHDVANFLAAQLREEHEVWEFSEYNFSGGVVRSQSFVEKRGDESFLALSEDERNRKRKWLREYASEASNLRGVRLEHEVFRPLAAYDYAQPPHAGSLFYERFHWVPYHPRIDYCRSKHVCEAMRGLA